MKRKRFNTCQFFLFSFSKIFLFAFFIYCLHSFSLSHSLYWNNSHFQTNEYETYLRCLHLATQQLLRRKFALYFNLTRKVHTKFSSLYTHSLMRINTDRHVHVTHSHNVSSANKKNMCWLPNEFLYVHIVIRQMQNVLKAATMRNNFKWKPLNGHEHCTLEMIHSWMRFIKSIFWWHLLVNHEKL